MLLGSLSTFVSLTCEGGGAGATVTIDKCSVTEPVKNLSTGRRLGSNLIRLVALARSRIARG